MTGPSPGAGPLDIEDPLVDRERGLGARLGLGVLGVVGALGAHVVAILLLVTLAPLCSPDPLEDDDDAIEVAVVEEPEEPEPPPPEVKPEPEPEPEPDEPEQPEPEPEPEPQPEPQKKPEPKPEAEPPPDDAPPEATKPMDPVNLEGLTMESTSDSGDFAVKVGNGIKTGRVTDKYVDPNRLGKIKTAKGGTGEGYGQRDHAIQRQRNCPKVEAKVDHKVHGAYPVEARRRMLEGVVVAIVHVDTSGKVTSVRIVKSAGNGFDASAKKAFAQWTFDPARADCHPVASDVRVTHRFSLDDL